MRAAAALLLGWTACTSIDASQPARYACARDGGDLADQCPGGWKCGLAGFCTDPNVGASVACVDSQTDCGGGWHCGVAGLCYDVGDAGAVACRFDGGDCAPGWRCGLSQLCHDTSVAAPLLCAVDSDCEQQWRCGPDGRCVDSHDDALRPNDALAPPTATLLNPLLPLGTPDVVATSSGASSPTGCDGQVSPMTTVTMSKGATVTRWHRYTTPIGGDCTVVPITTLDGEVAQTTLPSTVVSLADNGDVVYAVTDTGALYTLTFIRPTLTAALATGTPPAFVFKHVRPNSLSKDPVLIAFNDHQVTVLSRNGGWSDAGTVPAFDGGVPTVFDVEFLQPPFGSNLLMAATSEGLFAAVPSDLQTWQFAWQPCNGVKNAPPVFALAGAPGNTSAFVAMVQSDSLHGPPYTTAPQLFTFTNSLLGDCGPDLGGGVYLATQNTCGPCTGFIDGAVHALPDAGAAALYRCDDMLDGGLATHRCDLPGSSGEDFNDLATGLGTRLSGAGPGPLASVTAFGGIWLLPNPSEVAFEPATLPDLPVAVAGTAQELAVEYQPAALDVAGQYVQIAGASLQWSPGIGIDGQQESTDAPVFVAGVAGEPTWQLMTIPSFPSIALVYNTQVPGRYDGDKGGILVAQTPGPLASPIVAVTAPSADGGVLLLISSGDLLSAADVSRTAKPDSGVPLTGPQDVLSLPNAVFALAPLPHSQITSLVGLPPDADAGAAWARGYLVASGRIFEFRADGPVVWRSDEVSIEAAEAVSVWGDGPRARVGFRDGQVFTLPSRVNVAPPLAMGTSTAVTFAGFGCHSFALSTSGLYELVDDGGTVGGWQRVPLPSEDAGVSWARGALYTDGLGLAVFRERGFVDRVAVTPCP